MVLILVWVWARKKEHFDLEEVKIQKLQATKMTNELHLPFKREHLLITFREQNYVFAHTESFAVQGGNTLEKYAYRFLHPFSLFSAILEKQLL